MKIAIYGCGKMGGSIAEKLSSDHEVSIFDRNCSRTTEFAKKIKATYTSNLKDLIPKAEMIILAIKPQDLPESAKMIYPEVNKDQLVISVLAGITTRTLQEYFPEIPVLRIMPNMAVRFGQGIIGIADSDNLSKTMRNKAEALLKGLGFLHWIKESKIDALTALTGSGPAFVYIMIESIIDAGIAMGFKAEESKELTLKLIEGSLAVLTLTGKHPGELKWEITSPAGTTIAGVKALEDATVRSGIINTFLATYERTKELSAET